MARAVNSKPGLILQAEGAWRQEMAKESAERQKYNDLRDRLQAIGARIVQLGSELNKGNDDAAAELVQARAEEERLKVLLKAQEGRLREAQAQVKQAENALDALRREAIWLKSEAIKRQQVVVWRAEQSLNEARQTVGVLENSLKEAEDRLNSFHRRLEELTGEGGE